MEKSSIELRSERIRNIIGCVPPLLIRWGNFLIFFLWILLFLGSVLIAYPYKKEVSMYFKMVGPDKATVYVPADNIGVLTDSKELEMRLPAYSSLPNSPITGTFDSVKGERKWIDHTLYQEIVVKIESGIVSEKEELYEYEDWLQGVVVADMGKRTFWGRMFHSGKK